eukprot:TRINITY_DN35633_c0_g1_i1.p1 TRINITY_DN35633_c0_g1~~TRINITY_DN35633_c0_g1_i1.p1  ORF type:complete len:491 (-),score=98.50 TRINITY_DN35633_c0_g1_i1:183-1655(-)
MEAERKNLDKELEQLAFEMETIEKEMQRLRLLKSDSEAKIKLLKARVSSMDVGNENEKYCHTYSPSKSTQTHGLDAQSICRYSRHLLLPAFGIQGQSNLLKTSVLLVGAGGLGSPAALYLAACGIGCLGIIDHDVIEMNNLHRQVIHSEQSLGQSKVKSAAASCKAINSAINVVEHADRLMAKNALDIISKYDIVVDATDNLPTRYLINDCCVVLGKPLISGAALGLEGQLTVYNYEGGPCYRCILPSPPPIDACQSCSDNGVLGVVPGIIGCLQALEVIKISSKFGDTLSGRMLIFDASCTRFQTVKLRGRSLDCLACGVQPEITYGTIHNFDYEKFTQSPMSDKVPSTISLLPPAERITCKELFDHIKSGNSLVLLDVREKHQYQIAALPNSLNIPLQDLEMQFESLNNALSAASKHIPSRDSIPNENTSDACGNGSPEIPVYVICRRGNDSQKAVHYLHAKGLHCVWDVVGGLESWSKEVDPTFPSY